MLHLAVGAARTDVADFLQSSVNGGRATHKPEFDGEWVPISQVYDLQMGKTPSRDIPEYWNNGEHDWVSIKDLGSYEKYVGKTNETISELGRVKSGIKSVPANTLLMSFKLSLGKTAITTKETYTNEAIMAFLDKGTYDFDIDYMWHQLQSKDWTVGTNTAVMGKTLNKKTLSATKIRVPSISEQKEIAKHLDVVQETLSLLSLELKTLDDLVKSQFVEMFGDTYSNSKQLPSRKLGALIDFITSGSRGWSKYYSDEGDYFITIKNVRGCSISLDNVQHVHAPNNKEAERTKVQSGDVLISITADLGRTGVVSKEIADHGAYINQHLACIRLAGEDILPLYLSFFLESPGAKDQLQRKNQTGVKAGLNFDLVKSLDILVPPLALQQQFADFVARVDKLGFDCCREIVCCGVLFSSMSASLLCT